MIELLKALLMKLLLLHLLEMTVVGFAIPVDIQSPAKATGPNPENGQKPSKQGKNKSNNSSKVANTRQEHPTIQVSSRSKGRKYVYEIETESIEDETKDKVNSSKIEKDNHKIVHGYPKGEEKKITDNKTQGSNHALNDYAMVVDEDHDREGNKTMKTKTADSKKENLKETTKNQDYQFVPSEDVVTNQTTEAPLRLNIAI